MEFDEGDKCGVVKEKASVQNEGEDMLIKCE